MLKLLVLLTKSLPPSSRVRMTACFDEFHRHGVESTGIPIPSGLIDRVGLLQRAKKYDVVIIQKKTSFRHIELKFLQSNCESLIFDMDDAVMFHELEHHKPLKGKHFLKFLRTINSCQAVVAGNKSLATFAEANCESVFVLPTPIDISRYMIKDYSDISNSIVIGWIGVAGSLHYLKKISIILQQIAKEFKNIQLKIVSNEFIDIPGVSIIKEQWNLETETEHLRSFDIGIMPLTDSLWARGKCGYKILQYFGAGVHVIASPVGINTEFIKHGDNGLLAGSDQEWIESLRLLIKSHQTRKKIGMLGRKELEKYTLSRYAEKYCEILHSVNNKKAEF